MLNGNAAPGGDPGPQTGYVRTEDDALDGVLGFTLHGEYIQLRTLYLDESVAWLEKVAQEVASIEVVEDSAEDVFRLLLMAASDAAIRLIAAYDLDGVLGGAAGIRERRPRKRELVTAIERMVLAEDPFGQGVARLVGEAFGRPSVSLWRTVGALAAAGAMQALSIGGLAPDGASDGGRSDAAGPTSNSSSAGSTPSTKRTRKRSSA